MEPGTADVRTLHAKLWKLIEGDKITIRHNARCTSPDPTEYGFFHPDLYGFGPAIQLWRTRFDVVDDYAQELVTLAHEYGHALSHRRGERPRTEMPAPSPDLHENEKDIIQAEEARAWQYGRALLENLSGGVYDFALFNTRKREGDEGYATRLGR